MSNFHSDAEILREVSRHDIQAKEHMPNNLVFGTFYYGSGNYGLDGQNSDVDTKVITVPSIQEFYLNKAPLSHTYELSNGEHINYTDIRLYFNFIKKQNINFLEILFTKWDIVNPFFANEWQELKNNRELISRYNPTAAVKTMYGNIARCHKLVQRKDEYSSKQLCNLVRYYEFMDRYIKGEPYENCLISKQLDYLSSIKNGRYDCDAALELADVVLIEASGRVDNFNSSYEKNEEAEKLLQDIQIQVIKKAIINELKEEKL